MAEQSIINWLLALEQSSSPAGWAKEQGLLLGLIENAEKELPSLGSVSLMLRNALASIRHQRSLIQQGVTLNRISSREAALTALAIAEKQIEELDRLAVFLRRQNSELLANLDLFSTIKARVTDEVPAHLALEESLRSLREKIESLPPVFQVPGMLAEDRETQETIAAIFSARIGEIASGGKSAAGQIFDAFRQGLELSGVSLPAFEPAPTSQEKELPLDEDEFWRLVKDTVMAELRARLDSPQDHTAYIRARIDPVLNYVQP